MQRATLAIVFATALSFTAGAAPAADLGPMVPLPPPITEPSVTWGTGWYLRGDIGWGQQTQAQLSADIPAQTSKSTWEGDVGVGYKFNEWFRTDLTFGINNTQKNNLGGSTLYICPYQLTGLTDQKTGFQTGYLWSSQAGTCTSGEQAKLDQADLLLNGYVDLGTWYGFTPYVGAGLGVARLEATGSLNYYKTSDGSVYDADLTPTGTYPETWITINGRQIYPQPTIPGTNTPVSFSKQNWGQTIKKVKYNLAWALMGGVAYNIDEHAAIDIGYRYLNNGSFKSLPGVTSAGGVSKTLSTQEVRIGLRYLID